MTKVILDYCQLILTLHYAMTTSRLIDLQVVVFFHCESCEMLKDNFTTVALHTVGVTGRFRHLHIALLDSLFFINVEEGVTGQSCKLHVMSLVLGNDNKDTHLHKCSY